MIYDCFTFFNELDLLEIRLNILNEAVDKFVLVEATRTHRGADKPLYFSENKQRFAPFLNKIIHVIVDDYSKVEQFIASKNSDPMLWSWAYENFQRHSIIRGLSNLKDDDVIIVSDLDEIPTAEAVRKAARLANDGKVRLLQLSQRSFYLNFCNFSNPEWEWGPIILNGSSFKNTKTYDKVNPGDRSVRQVLSLPSPHLLRPMRPDGIIKKAGWHFSYMGGIKMICHKLKNFSHSEFSSDSFVDPNRIERAILRGGDIFKHGDMLFGSSIKRCLPGYILENAAKYSNMIFPVGINYELRTFMPKFAATCIHMVRKLTPHWIKRIYFRMSGV